MGTRESTPRRTLVQRRIVFLLAHELPLDAQERVLARWCEQELAAHRSSYRAVIHRPDGQNDRRNWHAYIVYALITLEREHNAHGNETGRYTFEAADRLPPMSNRLHELGGNGPRGRRGAGRSCRAGARRSSTSRTPSFAASEQRSVAIIAATPRWA